MRVIAGVARSLQLKTIKGMDTRPTTDRIKETLFNILQPDLEDCSFLDLFAGSGAIGIEALSRGAREAVFVENNPAAVLCIRENLRFTRLQDYGKVIEDDVLRAIWKMGRERKTGGVTDTGRPVAFGIVFLDPPYHLGMEKETLTALAEAGLIDRNSVVIVEALRETDFGYLGSIGYEMIREKVYKTNRHLFLRWMGDCPKTSE